MISVSDADLSKIQEQLEIFGYAPNPFCPVCRGVGLIHPLNKDGHTDYSKTVNCKAPGCLADSVAKWQSSEKCYLFHGVSTWGHTFGSYWNRKGTAGMVSAFKALAEGNDKPFLFCAGITGTGKSHLCEALTVRLLQRGINAWYYSVSSLMSLLKQHIEDKTVEDLIARFCNLEALILDDWGAEYGTDWEAAQLDHIVDERYRHKLITVLVSNKNMSTLEEKSARIISRFTDNELSVMVVNTATDYRPQKQEFKR